VDAVHDMRTATRRLRTAIKLHGDEAPKKERRAVEDELKEVARRLGTVRDLDVLLETLDAEEAVEPLRDAWRSEREAGVRKLKGEIGRRRFRRSIREAKDLVQPAEPDDGEARVVTRAPGRIWDAFGAVLAHDVDPDTADPAAIHQLRIAAKKLRYTLEAFQDALEPSAGLIEQVTELQDAAGSMHDGIVAAERARATAEPLKLTKPQREAIDTYADGQLHDAERLRPAIARSLQAVRSRRFRESLGRSVAGMGHVAG
jgi:CHAD domain-containing protein